MPDCGYCGTPINEEYNFCINCEKQVKCLNPQCKGYLLPEKSKCLKCGTPVGVSQLSEKDTILNKFHLEQKQSENSSSIIVDAVGTDNAIAQIAPWFTGHLPVITVSPINNQRPITIPEQKTALPSVSENQETINIENENLSDNTNTLENSKQPLIDCYDPLTFFEPDEQGFLLPKTRDYKGKTKKEQQKRFCLLYVWAYNIVYQKPVPDKEHFNHVAKQNIAPEQNFTTYFKEFAKLYFLKSDSLFKLNNDGLYKVKEFLSDIQNPDLKGVDYSKQSNKSANKKYRVNKEDMQKVEQWIEKESQFDTFDVRQLKTTANYALFSLYILTKELKFEQAIKPALAYQYLKGKYTTISIEQNTFTSILTHKDYKKYFERTSDGLYYLTHEGENAIKNSLNDLLNNLFNQDSFETL